MMAKPPILCPVDFSDASRGALRYAAALAEHFGSELRVMTVNDPLLAEAAAMETSATRVHEETLAELTRFYEQAIGTALKPDAVAFEVSTGKPAPEILRAVRETDAGLLVISSHGLTGFRKMFFGSTTERVLRETTVPVLVVPGNDTGPSRLAGIAPAIRRILLPVDLSAASAAQLAVVEAIARVVHASVVLLTVVEPVRAVLPMGAQHLPSIERERRARAEIDLDALAGVLDGVKVEALIAYGEPSEEIVKVAADRDVNLIVIGMHATYLAGPRIGSVTYRVLAASQKLVLAIPPPALT